MKIADEYKRTTKNKSSQNMQKRDKEINWLLSSLHILVWVVGVDNSVINKVLQSYFDNSVVFYKQ